MNDAECKLVQSLNTNDAALYFGRAIQRGEDIEPLVNSLKLNPLQSAVSWVICKLSQDSMSIVTSSYKRNLALLETEVDDNQNTILHWAILRKHISAIRHLGALQGQDSWLKAVNINNETCFHVAAWNCSFKMFKFMLGFVPSSISQTQLGSKDIFGLEPLSILYITFEKEMNKITVWRQGIQKVFKESYVRILFPNPVQQELVPLFRDYLLQSDSYLEYWKEKLSQVSQRLDVLFKTLLMTSPATGMQYEMSLMSFVVVSRNLQLMKLVENVIPLCTNPLALWNQLILGIKWINQDMIYNDFGFKHFKQDEKEKTEKLYESNLIVTLIANTPRNLWSKVIELCALSYDMKLLNYIASLGLQPDLQFLDSKTPSLDPLPGETIWHQSKDKVAIAALFRAGSDWIPDQYRDPRNFFTKLFSKNSFKPLHLWWQFVEDFDIELNPNDWRRKVAELTFLQDQFQSMTNVKTRELKKMKANQNCMVCFDEMKGESEFYGPAGNCTCVMCETCIRTFIENMYQNWGNEVVMCPGDKCKKLIHYAFLQQLLSKEIIKEEQFRCLLRRQFKSYWLRKYPDWKFCSDECLGGKSIPANASSNFLQCEFCWKRACFKCGQKHAVCADTQKDITAFRQILENGRKIGGKDRPCSNPKCNEMIYREFGCNGVVCWKCGREFHWNYGEPENIPLTMRLTWSNYMKKYNKRVPHDSEDLPRLYETVHDQYRIAKK